MGVILKAVVFEMRFLGCVVLKGVILRWMWSLGGVCVEAHSSFPVLRHPVAATAAVGKHHIGMHSCGI